MTQDYVESWQDTGPRGGSVKIWQAVAAGEILGNFKRKADAEKALGEAIEYRRTFEGFVASVDYDRQDWQYATIYQVGKPVLNLSRPRLFGDSERVWEVTDANGQCVFTSRMKPTLAMLARLARAYVETMQEGAAYRVAQEQEESFQPVAKDSPEYDLQMSASECESALTVYGEDLVSGYAEGLQELHGGNAAEWESKGYVVTCK